MRYGSAAAGKAGDGKKPVTERGKGRGSQRKRQAIVAVVTRPSIGWTGRRATRESGKAGGKVEDVSLGDNYDQPVAAAAATRGRR